MNDMRYLAEKYQVGYEEYARKRGLEVTDVEGGFKANSRAAQSEL
jgi:hypothetical protein